LYSYRVRGIERRLARRAQRGLTLGSDDIYNRFIRLDVHGMGALDETKAQLLISWAFDVDFDKQVRGIDRKHSCFYPHLRVLEMLRMFVLIGLERHLLPFGWPHRELCDPGRPLPVDR